MITGIDHVHVTTFDMDKSIDFYTNVLGFHFLRRVEFGPEDNRRELAYVGLGDILLELLPPPPGVDAVVGTAQRPLALTVTDVDAVMPTWRPKESRSPPSPGPGFSFYGVTAVVTDPSGLAIELRECAAATTPTSRTGSRSVRTWCGRGSPAPGARWFTAQNMELSRNAEWEQSIVDSRLVKYMGSKRNLLANGLGQIILEEAQHSSRIVDLFCGASSVVWFSAEHTELPVFAVDLQEYAVALADAVISRTETLDPAEVGDNWFRSVVTRRECTMGWLDALDTESAFDSVPQLVEESRRLCSSVYGSGLIWRSYGGYYFSPSQAATIDAMIKCLPRSKHHHSVCLAATIASGSQCAASPGHTAQPFQPTVRGAPFIAEAWARDPLVVARKALEELCTRRARVVGASGIGEAVEVASSLSSSDLVIVDPPYSGVQYSRFYHVLEAIASGIEQPVSGSGRYPELLARPQSSFSRSSRSRPAIQELLENLARVGATVILTFPAGETSNGLSGQTVTSIARSLFNVKEHRITGRFSTLGGNNSNRSARTKSDELVLVMKPRTIVQCQANNAAAPSVLNTNPSPVGPFKSASHQFGAIGD